MLQGFGKVRQASREQRGIDEALALLQSAEGSGLVPTAARRLLGLFTLLLGCPAAEISREVARKRTTSVKSDRRLL